MNILHVTPYYAPAYAFGGVVRAAEGMARALAARGHDVTVLTTDALTADQRFDGSREETIDGVQVVRGRNASVWLRGRLNLSTPLGFRRADLVAAADVVHLHELRTTEALMIAPLAGMNDKPLLLSPHGTLTPTTGRPMLKSLWDRLLTPRVARQINSVVALTEHEAEEARALWRSLNLPEPSTVIVPNGIDPAPFAALPDPADFRLRHGLGDDSVCLFMGRLHPRKGAALLAEAFLRADLTHARLVIAGPDEGAEESVAALAAQSGGRIVMTGYLGGEDRLAAYAAADVFALPAVGEGLPMAALEAMAAGLPVILSPGCNLPEVGEVDAGMIVPVETDAWAAALWMLLSDPVRRRELSANARRLIDDRFTEARAAERLEAVYQSIMVRSV